jgi:hypothetical protein
MSITAVDYVGNYVGNLGLKFWSFLIRRLGCEVRADGERTNFALVRFR